MEVLYDGVATIFLTVFVIDVSFQLSFVINDYKSLINLFLKNLSVSPNVGMFTLQFVEKSLRFYD